MAARWLVTGAAVRSAIDRNINVHGLPSTLARKTRRCLLMIVVNAASGVLRPPWIAKPVGNAPSVQSSEKVKRVDIMGGPK